MLRGYSRRVVGGFICVGIVIVIIIVLLLVVLIHSCDATFMKGGSKIILVGKAFNEQWSISVG